mmetsp:Transcript_10873/g.26296  ORF Transcript_10873/g.26296 Transcript_10873/m.26296 type:complete len:247 (-) Transcript_10873:354-1094(-)
MKASKAASSKTTSRSLLRLSPCSRPKSFLSGLIPRVFLSCIASVIICLRSSVVSIPVGLSNPCSSLQNSNRICPSGAFGSTRPPAIEGCRSGLNDPTSTSGCFGSESAFQWAFSRKCCSWKVSGSFSTSFCRISELTPSAASNKSYLMVLPLLVVILFFSKSTESHSSPYVNRQLVPNLSSTKELICRVRSPLSTRGMLRLCTVALISTACSYNPGISLRRFCMRCPTPIPKALTDFPVRFSRISI